MEKRHVFIFYWFPVIIYCTAIFIQSSFPSSEYVPNIVGFDKILHFGAYGLLGVLFFRAYMAQNSRNSFKNVILLSMLSSSFYGVTDEIHQYFVVGRDADLIDIFADITGSVCGVGIYYLIRIKKLEF